MLEKQSFINKNPLMNYDEIDGDLIELTKEGRFQIIAHGCNCFCRMKRGIAPQMAEAFKCDYFELEADMYEGDPNKLGQIDWETLHIREDGYVIRTNKSYPDTLKIVVINAYTQYEYDTTKKPFDYEAFTLCMRKIALTFPGGHIGLPKIGSHLAGGDWNQIKQIIQRELCPKMLVTVVNYIS
jgi:O-acetyl-ADP-ribose deacetylase (regulator of RNase III)